MSLFLIVFLLIPNVINYCNHDQNFPTAHLSSFFFYLV